MTPILELAMTFRAQVPELAEMWRFAAFTKSCNRIIFHSFAALTFRVYTARLPSVALRLLC